MTNKYFISTHLYVKFNHLLVVSKQKTRKIVTINWTYPMKNWFWFSFSTININTYTLCSLVYNDWTISDWHIISMWVVSHIIFHRKWYIIIRTIEENNLEYKHERRLFFLLSIEYLFLFFFYAKRSNFIIEKNGVTKERFYIIIRLFLNILRILFVFF